jgi:membrane associated rhomboid family serine protease/Zn-finger nucleic acid-binding protein
MKCPGCDSDLREKRYHEIAVDTCPACRGIWFDQNELVGFIHLFLEDHQDLPNSTIQLSKAITSTELLDEPCRCCPRCGAPLNKINYAYDSNIIVDKCVSCDGIWVDGPEVKQLAVYTKGNPKLDKLGVSLAEHVTEQQELHDMIETAPVLAGSVGAWLFLPKIILPVGDDTERRTVPVVTLGIILTNIAVLLWMYLMWEDLPSFFAAYGFVPQRIMAGEGKFTFVSAMFLHAGVAHIAGNTLFLWIFGDNVEDAFGHILFAGFYLACGICASLTFLLLHMDSNVAGLGASGAIGGVMGAYFVLYPQARVKTFVICTVLKIPAYLYLGLWFLCQLLFVCAYGAQERIGFSAHTGGFAAGIVLALLLRLVRPCPSMEQARA